MDYMIPVGGMIIANITAQGRFLILPPQMENIIEVHPVTVDAKVCRTGYHTSWYESSNQSAYLDPLRPWIIRLISG
jgi:hypothetical protein